jgi:hypothetical protein
VLAGLAYHGGFIPAHRFMSIQVSVQSKQTDSPDALFVIGSLVFERGLRLEHEPTYRHIESER